MSTLVLKRILIAAFLVLTPCAAIAGPFEDGLAAYDANDYATALKLWRPLAEQGDAKAQSAQRLLSDMRPAKRGWFGWGRAS